MKKFWIAMGSLIAVLAIATTVTLTVLATQRVKVDFVFAEPNKISVYDKSKTTKTIEKQGKNIASELNETMNRSKLSLLGDNAKVNIKPRLVIDTQYNESIKEENKCVFFEYNEEQSAILYYENNTKKIKYKKLLIVLNESDKTEDHTVYYSIDGEKFENEQIIVAFCEKPLQKLF